MTKKEVGLLSRFWKHNNPSELNNMTDEQVLQLVDEYLEGYIKRFERRNPHKPLPNLEKTIAEIRNKRTNVSKKPQIAGRKSYD